MDFYVLIFMHFTHLWWGSDVFKHNSFSLQFFSVNVFFLASVYSPIGVSQMLLFVTTLGIKLSHVPDFTTWETYSYE